MTELTVIMNTKEVVTNKLSLQNPLQNTLREDIAQYEEKKGIFLKFVIFAHRCSVGTSDRKVRTPTI